MTKIDSSASEYMKIRRYMFNLIQKSDGEMVQVPTILELAAKFNVSRPTVSKALKALTEEGYIIGKPGIGSFTNPARTAAAFSLKHLPVVGIIIADGMLVHYEQFLAGILGNLMLAIVRIPAVVHLINLTSSKPSTMVREIMNEDLDALVWYGGKPDKSGILEPLRQAGVTVVTSDNIGVSSDDVSFDYETLGYECGKLLIAEGRRNPVFLIAAYPWDRPVAGIRKAFSEAGLPLNENLFLKNYLTAYDDLRKILSLGMPVDAIVNAASSSYELRKILAEFSVDTGSACRLIQASCSDVNTPDDIIYDYPFDQHAAQVCSLLKSHLSGNTAGATGCLKTKITIRQRP
ncbi:MAG: GntR family transcriptional regulator [Spirochaetes bacterium]|nr:GntR family transcriptional regulator [Spirochaetota bacterium]